jgi:hypothetical protein
MTTERKRPSGGDGRLDFRCLGSGEIIHLEPSCSQVGGTHE